MDLGQALQAQPFSSLSVGSEFRPASVLAPLCDWHPLWHCVQCWLSLGIDYPLSPLSDDDRLADLTANLARGNHQSATFNLHHLTGMMLQDEVKRGWQLILACESVIDILGAVLAPLGLVEQDTINKLGELIPKWRLIHDQSFNVIRGTKRSVNDQVIEQELTPCCYGWALIQFIHTIVGLRRRHPRKQILQMKVDLKSAYCHLHYHYQMVVQSVVVIGEFALIALHMTFGGAPNPSQWSDVSELATDLANTLVRCDDWDPSEFSSPHQHLLGSAYEFEPDDFPFAKVDS